MMSQLFQRLVSPVIRQVPLQTALIVPFILQISAAVGLTGYLSWQNGQKAVNDVAYQLRDEVTERVQLHLQNYLSIPPLINQINTQALQNNYLDFDQIEKSEYFLWQQVQLFPSVYANYIANEAGQFISVRRDLDGQLIAKTVEYSPTRESYLLDNQGIRSQFQEVDLYDPRVRPWYQATLKTRQPNWSKIYTFTGGEIGITASAILEGDNGEIRSIVGVDILLSLISNFLKTIDISENGQVFIIESSGLLVASSTPESPVIVESKFNDEKRLSATKSRNLLTHTTANYLTKKFGDLNQIQTPYQLDFQLQGERQFVQVVPYGDQIGLNWLIVVVVPENDFMAQIHANTRTTILLCIFALLIALVLGFVTSKWLTKPVLRLNQAAKNLTLGNWNQQVTLSRCNELKELGYSFNLMATQLQDYFHSLEDKNIAMQRLNERLAQSQQRLYQFLEGLPVGVLVVNAEKQIVFSNQKLQQILGQPINTEIDIDHFPQFHQLYLAETDQFYPIKGFPLKRALNGKTIKIDNLEIRYSDQIIPCEVLGTPIFNHHKKVIYATVVFQDITQRKLVEKERQNFTAQLKQKNKELERLDQIKDEFLANTSHELRTPLNGMIGLAESMLEGATGRLTEVQRKNLSMIGQSGHRLATLVNDILDFSKLRHNTIELQLKPIGLREITEVVLAVVQPLTNHKPIQLINAISDDIPLANADENRLQQILYNLIGNAIKFTQNGTVTVSASISTTNDQLINIKVSDTGIGIAEDKLSRIFESFEQADGSTAREYGGTGLGLAVTQQLINLHGGDIWVESTVGVGSDFMFTLPKAEEIEEIQATQQQKIESDSPSLFSQPILQQNLKLLTPIQTESKSIKITANTDSLSYQSDQFKILIVDDDPVNLQVLVNYLHLHNYAVMQATGGLEAIGFLEAGYIPDLILLDVMMPRMTGYEVTRKIRETWPPHQLPIMMLTAKNQVSDLVSGFEVGANDYLSKPLNKDELLARIKTHLGIQQLRTEKAHIRKTFGRYVTEEIVNNLLETDEGLKLGGERRTITMLTSDLRGFTAFSERLPPEEVVKILNFYLSKMADIITAYYGTIDEFMGDGILVLFGAPTVGEDDVQRAIACGISMQLEMETVNQQMKAWGFSALEMGIGINTGEVVVGNIGSEKRTKYGVVGNQVNLTYRIESYTTGGQILISESTFNQAYSILNIIGQNQVQPKGARQPLIIYDVGGIAGEYNLFLPQQQERFLPLSPEIALYYTILEGKHVNENVFPGKLVELSEKGGKIQAETNSDDCIPLSLTNIKLNFIWNNVSSQWSEDVYAKVTQHSAEINCFYIRFTAKPPQVEAQIAAIYNGTQEAIK
ncbi:MAG: adenylate/guanylate cyclase domain-containing protein [Microcoleaceae cyanobacterium]